MSLLLASVTEGRGWIGSWSPGIGDPTVIGWVATLAYLATSYTCHAIGRVLSRIGRVARDERWLWRGLAWLFLALGLNKQLDLQTALIESGRILAYGEGWYEQRQSVQLAFIELVAVAALAAAIGLLLFVRRMPAPVRMAAAGTVVVFGFVAVRAAGFNHIDRLLDTAIFESRWDFILELGGLSIVLVAATLRLRAVRALGGPAPKH